MDISVDATVLRVDDIYQRENQNRAFLQNLDWRLQRLEDLNMNTYELVRTVLSNQTIDRQDRLNRFHNQALSCDDELHQLQRNKRRCSSLTCYDLHSVKNTNMPRSSTTVMDQTPSNKKILSILDQILSSRKSNLIPTRSTMHRLNSFPSNDSSINRIQSHEYTSITDVIDTSFHHHCRSSSPTNARPSAVDDDSVVSVGSGKIEISAYDAEEQTHNLIGEIIRKRVRKTSVNPSNPQLDPLGDSDRASLMSVDLNSSSSNLNFELQESKT